MGADEATCSKTLLDGTTATTCTATTMTAPARKRRQTNESDLDNAYDLAAPAASPLISDAECVHYDHERKVCLEAVEVKSSGATTTCAASTMLTVLTAGLLR